MLSDPFQDDPVLPTPKPTSAPTNEVRRPPANKMKPVSTPAKETVAAKDSPPAMPAASANASPYKVVNKQTTAPPPKTIVRKPTSTITATEEVRTIPTQSILRQASAETAAVEPAPHNINRARALPIVRSQSPDHTDNEIPLNPLR
jgi:hypothetical protein